MTELKQLLNFNKKLKCCLHFYLLIFPDRDPLQNNTMFTSVKSSNLLVKLVNVIIHFMHLM